MRAIVFIVLLAFTCALGAQEGAPDLDAHIERLEAAIESLDEQQLEETERRTAQQALEQALAYRRTAFEETERLEALRTRLDKAPELIAEAQAALAVLKSREPQVRVEEYAGRALGELEEVLAELNAELSESQGLLGEANSLITAAQTRPERAQANIGRDQARLQEITNLLKSGRDGPRALEEERQEALEAERVLLETRLAFARQELAGNSLLHDLGRAQRELAQERIRHLEYVIEAVQARIAEQRRVESVQAVAELAVAGDMADRGGLLGRERALNRQFSDYLLEATEHLSELNRRNLVTRQQLDNLNQIERTLEEQISVLQGSRLLSRILYQQREALPRYRIERGLADRIADVRLYQFEIGQQREQLSNPAAAVDRLLVTQSEVVVTEELRDALLAVLLTRVELLERLNRELNEVLNEAITLQINQRQLEALAERLRATLDEQMFWVPSNRPLSWSWLQSAPERLAVQFEVIPWGAGVKEFATALKQRPLLLLPLLLVVVVLWRRRWLYRCLDELHKDVGNVRQDTHWHTPGALLINVVLALPGTVLLALAGYALMLDGQGQNANIGAALMTMSMTWLVLYSVYRVLTPGGVAEHHFHWDAGQVRYLHRRMRPFGFVVLVLTGIVTFARRQPSMLAEDVLGIVVVLFAYVAMTSLMRRLIWHSPERENLSGFRTLLALILSIVPLGLFVAVSLGYYYTALQLTDRLIQTIYILLAWGMLEAASVRGLAVAARRLAFQRALSKRQATAASRESSGEAVEVLEEPVLGMDQINQQSLRVLKLILLGLALVTLYWIWADVIEVFTYLETITLYEYTSGSGEAANVVPISLGDVLGALLIVVVAVLLARNLPGLLEVLVLSRISLAQGSAYAITTLLSYLIISIGIVSTLATLGVSWDKLQWLVAALGVGLGFGLQEIFANFVSGLIILFERPMRIGDVVTVGDLSGTVSKIRIRATTIIDFDRKEIIVPNKTFVTGQLINWSLTDTVTRVIIHLGVGYGADLEKVRELLLRVAEENPRVLRDPEPLVFFLDFGDSRLEHELRIHVRELADRNPAIDEINRAIDRLFHEHGIEIAFRQMDVHIRSLAGIERKLESVSVSTAPGPDGPAVRGSESAPG